MGGSYLVWVIMPGLGGYTCLWVVILGYGWLCQGTVELVRYRSKNNFNSAKREHSGELLSCFINIGLT